MINIQVTDDYNQFKFFPERQRPVLTDKIYESIKQCNKLEYNPIIVTKDMYVLDGQHRLDAARRLQVPIYYRIDLNGTIEDIPLYQRQTPWTMKDYLNFYKPIKDSYRTIYNLCETYNLFHNLTFVIAACTGSEHPTKDFKNGAYKLKTDVSKLETYFANLRDVTETIKSINFAAYLHKNALAALMSIICGADYDHKRFLHKLISYPDNVMNVLKLKDYRNIREAFRDKVYNHYCKVSEKRIA